MNIVLNNIPETLPKQIMIDLETNTTDPQDGGIILAATIFDGDSAYLIFNSHLHIL
jgi:hypothetical protein